MRASCKDAFLPRTGEECTFAPLAEDTPTEAKVAAAKRSHEKKEQERAAQAESVIALQSAIGKEKESILREVQLLYAVLRRLPLQLSAPAEYPAVPVTFFRPK